MVTINKILLRAIAVTLGCLAIATSCTPHKETSTTDDSNAKSIFSRSERISVGLREAVPGTADSFAKYRFEICPVVISKNDDDSEKATAQLELCENLFRDPSSGAPGLAVVTSTEDVATKLAAQNQTTDPKKYIKPVLFGVAAGTIAFIAVRHLPKLLEMGFRATGLLEFVAVSGGTTAGVAISKSKALGGFLEFSDSEKLLLNDPSLLDLDNMQKMKEVGAGGIRKFIPVLQNALGYTLDPQAQKLL